MNYLDTVTKLRRGPGRDKVHRADCRYATEGSLPWIWAEDKTRAEVEAAKLNGLKFCKTCDPLGAIE